MVANLGLVVLQLRLVLLGGQVQRVEGRCELTRRPVVIIHVKAILFILARPSVFLLFEPELHQVFKFGLDVGENGETGQVPESRAFVSQLLRLNHVDLREKQNKKASKHVVKV